MRSASYWGMAGTVDMSAGGKIRERYAGAPKACVQIQIEYTDGSKQTVATDGSWKASYGPIREGDFLMGETYDARLEMPGWDTPEFDASEWHAVDRYESPSIAIEAYPGVTIKKIEEIQPVSITEPEPGRLHLRPRPKYGGWRG